MLFNEFPQGGEKWFLITIRLRLWCLTGLILLLSLVFSTYVRLLGEIIWNFMLPSILSIWHSPFSLIVYLEASTRLKWKGEKGAKPLCYSLDCRNRMLWHFLQDSDLSGQCLLSSVSRLYHWNALWGHYQMGGLQLYDHASIFQVAFCNRE